MMMKSKTLKPAHALAGLSLLMAAALPIQAQTPFKLPLVELKLGQQTIEAEVASTEAQRSQGLMYRHSLDEGRGMLFVFDSPGQYCFWMKNTLIPLSIAFINERGTITDLADMAPQDERSHCPTKAIRYALEVNQGWFGQQGVKVGDTLEGLPAQAE
ncbi:MAG: DUF192 domain-containing protein [Lautropia sp.]|nr:DUF192 domain-containing protein [Lautropia sp.]